MLKDNLGKVLFIDEAYSLLNDSRDPYGLDALNTLNLFMSENPNGIVVIFAGYKDLLENGIFKAQPGLPRRCMWHFECDGYNGSQLSDIFIRQLEGEGWASDDEGATRSIIEENLEIFPSYGGDTERLCFFSQLESSRDEFVSSTGESSNKLTVDHIKKGIERLRRNNLHRNESSKSQTNPTTSDLLEGFKHMLNNKKQYTKDDLSTSG